MGGASQNPQGFEEAIMKRITGALVIAFLFAGCADGKFHKRNITTGPCGPVVGYTYTAIAYGDGKLVVIPVSDIRANTEWRFYLFPLDNLGGKTPSNNVHIKIKGQNPAVPPVASGGNNIWIDIDGSYNTATKDGSLRFLVDCTPASLVSGDEHKFEVTIDGIGTLDPRGHVD
jgi:hypothetical protein